MGLDMRAIAVARNRPNVVTETLAVWRKHPDLHGWVEDRARRYGVIGNINRAFAPLGLQDLDAMERDIRAKRLPKTEGLFFGSSSKGRAQQPVPQPAPGKTGPSLINESLPCVSPACACSLP